MGIPPSILRGRIRTTTYLYDDTKSPDRVTGTVASPLWTDADRDLLLGLAEYESTLCRCGVPKTEAWHAQSDGEYEAHAFVCHACSAEKDEEVVYRALIHGPPRDRVAKYPEFDLLTMTSEPTKKE